MGKLIYLLFVSLFPVSSSLVYSLGKLCMDWERFPPELKEDVRTNLLSLFADRSSISTFPSSGVVAKLLYNFIDIKYDWLQDKEMKICIFRLIHTSLKNSLTLPASAATSLLLSSASPFSVPASVAPHSSTSSMLSSPPFSPNATSSTSSSSSSSSHEFTKIIYLLGEGAVQWSSVPIAVKNLFFQKIIKSSESLNHLKISDVLSG
jgi:hypothetical protein